MTRSRLRYLQLSVAAVGLSLSCYLRNSKCESNPIKSSLKVNQRRTVTPSTGLKEQLNEGFETTYFSLKTGL
jgi:hypothetical protein